MDKEQQWLPVLAPLLPLAIPIPLARGAPGEGYPWHWSIYRWLEGEDATLERIADPRQVAVALAEFIAALQRIDPTGRPPPGPHNAYRGVPLAARDAQTRAAIASLDGAIDVAALTAAWAAALLAPAWISPPVWIRGDLQSGNLLAVQGRLSAVIGRCRSTRAVPRWTTPHPASSPENLRRCAWRDPGWEIRSGVRAERERGGNHVCRKRGDLSAVAVAGPHSHGNFRRPA